MFRGFIASLILLCIATASASNAVAEDRYAALVMDAASGEILFDHKADARRHPASLSKMMTLYLTFEAIRSKTLRREQHLLVSANAARMPATKLGIKQHETITVEQSIMALITKSANDVSVVLAEALGGNEDRFAVMMTKRARQLGMRNTVFKNASGLHEPGQITTARDMALLARALIQTFPDDYSRYFRIRSFKYYGRTVYGHNNVVDVYSGADGLKTGYTRASGYNLATSAVRQGTRLIGIVLGGPSANWRDRHMIALLNKGFLSVGIKPPVVAASWRANTLNPPKERPSRPTHTARAAATPSRSTSSTPGKTYSAGPWGVQVGAYALQSLARRHAIDAVATLNDLTAGVKPMVMPVQVGGSTLFRARVIGFSRRGAASACTRIKRIQGDCFVISPDQIQSLAQADIN